MTKSWNSIEKIIASLQIIFGLLIICLVFYYNIVSINFILNSSNLSWEDLSFYKIFKKFFSAIINPSLFLISGFLLFKSNIKGWVIGLSMWLMLGFDALLIILNISPQKHIILKNSENLFFFFYFVSFFNCNSIDVKGV